MELYSTNEISQELHLTNASIFHRCKVLGIERIKDKDNKKNFLFTEDDFQRLKNYVYKKSPLRRNNYQKNKIQIIEKYLKNKSNSVEEISKDLNISQHKIHQCIDEYLENGTITVMSEL